MPRQGKTPKKKSPQESEESKDPAMDPATINEIVKRVPGRATRPRTKTTKGGRAGQKVLAPLSCALTIGALWDTSKYKKVSCSEPLGVTILLRLP